MIYVLIIYSIFASFMRFTRSMAVEGLIRYMDEHYGLDDVEKEDIEKSVRDAFMKKFKK